MKIKYNVNVTREGHWRRKSTQFLAREKAHRNITEALVQTWCLNVHHKLFGPKKIAYHCIRNFGLKWEINEKQSKRKGYKLHACVWVDIPLSFLQPLPWPTSPNQTNYLTHLSSTQTCFCLTYLQFNSVNLFCDPP